MGETRHCRSNRLRVHAAHDFANVLFLPAKRAVRFDFMSVEHGFQQLFVESNLPQVGFPQCDQLLAEFLQCQILAFSRAFAGL